MIATAGAEGSALVETNASAAAGDGVGEAGPQDPASRITRNYTVRECGKLICHVVESALLENNTFTGALGIFI